MKKLIIWDFDGPIVDSRELALELTQFNYHDVTEHLHRDLFNGNIFAEIDKLSKKDVTEEEYALFLEQSYWPRKLDLPPVEGIADALRQLAEDFVMVVNSSAHAYEISKYLEKNDLLGFFDRVYGNEIKSKEEKFKIILDTYACTARDCVLITDTLGDVIEAEALNIRSIVVLWGYQLRKHFDRVCDQVVFGEHPSELARLVHEYFSDK